MTISTAMNILYIEDDSNSRTVMRMMMKNRLHIENIVIWEDSQGFAERIEALDPKPDMIFLDIHVYPLNGFAMLELLRQHPDFAHVPIVALTASVMNEEVDRLRSAGFNGCLAKPLNINRFADYLQQILENQYVWTVTDLSVE